MSGARCPHEDNMTEWYVLLIDGRPKEVILGRLDALAKLVGGYPLTYKERRRLGFLRETMPDLFDPVTIVGTDDGLNRTPDRTIVRVTGPGTEV